MPGARGARRAQERDGFGATYCRVFAEGELRALVAGEARVDECYYDEGNWAVACTVHDVVLLSSPPPPLIKNNLRDIRGVADEKRQ